DSSLVAVSVSDSAGNFSFTNLSSGLYLIRITALGIRDTLIRENLLADDKIKDLGKIYLHRTLQTLHEVVVSYSRPPLEHKLDRTIMRLNEGITEGNSAMDIFSKIPGVIIKPDESFTLMGKNNVLIYINDRPSNMSESDLKTFLKNLPANQLLQIEIISNPSARYDASGTSGIINLVLKKGYNQGWNINFTTRTGFGIYPKNNEGFHAGYSNGKVNAFVSLGLNTAKTFEHNTMSKIFAVNNSTSEFDQNNYIPMTSTDQTLRTGLDFQPDRKNTLGFIFQTGLYRETILQHNYTSVSDPINGPDSTFLTQSTSRNQKKNYSLNLNYHLKADTSGSVLDVNLDYSTYALTSLSRYQTHYFQPDGKPVDSLLFTNTLPGSIHIGSVRLDYTRSFPHGIKLECGVKASTIQNNTQTGFTVNGNKALGYDSLLNNSFDYQETIYAAYLSLSRSFKRFSFQTGLREEETSARGGSEHGIPLISRNYRNLFPSIFADIPLVPEKHSLSFSYSRRIDRPYYSDLNPFYHFIDPYTFLAGNPLLVPQLTDALELNYTLHGKYVFTVFYNYSTHVIIQVPEQLDATQTTILRTNNIDQSLQPGIAFSAPVTVCKAWEITGNAYFYQKQYTSALPSGNLNTSANTYELYLNNSFKLPQGWGVECSGLYVSPFVNGLYKTNALYSLSGALKKSFLNKRLQARISIEDALYTYYVQNRVDFQNQHSTINQRFDSRIFWISLSYHFSRGPEVKADKHKSGNAEEQQRVK
ncbi:MAG TPA: TonB-dependent receptor, partial [Bacteroidia bacterium]|nr:TonB-dependent receptor [Bacteroidia bacterium]